jgi:hypothetical protein
LLESSAQNATPVPPPEGIIVETVALDFESGTMARADPEELENAFDPDVHVPDKVFHPLFVVDVENVSEKELKALSLVVKTLLFADLFINLLVLHFRYKLLV